MKKTKIIYKIVSKDYKVIADEFNTYEEAKKRMKALKEPFSQLVREELDLLIPHKIVTIADVEKDLKVINEDIRLSTSSEEIKHLTIIKNNLLELRD